MLELCKETFGLANEIHERFETLWHRQMHSAHDCFCHDSWNLRMPKSLIASIASYVPLCLVWGLSFASTLLAVETVKFNEDADEGQPAQRTVVGKLLVEAQDGGLMLMADDGRIWTIQPDQIVDRKSDDNELVPLSDEEMASRMLEEMPKGFSIYRTANYVIVHNTSEAYAKLVGAQYEQLFPRFFCLLEKPALGVAQTRISTCSAGAGESKRFLKVRTGGHRRYSQVRDWLLPFGEQSIGDIQHAQS